MERLPFYDDHRRMLPGRCWDGHLLFFVVSLYFVRVGELRAQFPIPDLSALPLVGLLLPIAILMARTRKWNTPMLSA
jgi:hypothetical protein